MTIIADHNWPLSKDAEDPRRLCRAVGLVKAHYSETIEITLNQQPEGYDEKLLLTGDDAGFARDSLGCYLTGNLAVDVYWGPSGAVQVVRRVTF